MTINEGYSHPRRKELVKHLLAAKREQILYRVTADQYSRRQRFDTAAPASAAHAASVRLAATTAARFNRLPRTISRLSREVKTYLLVQLGSPCPDISLSAGTPASWKLKWSELAIGLLTISIPHPDAASACRTKRDNQRLPPVKALKFDSPVRVSSATTHRIFRLSCSDNCETYRRDPLRPRSSTVKATNRNPHRREGTRSDSMAAISIIIAIPVALSIADSASACPSRCAHSITHSSVCPGISRTRLRAIQDRRYAPTSKDIEVGPQLSPDLSFFPPS
jgi:hypothetical protein